MDFAQSIAEPLLIAHPLGSTKESGTRWQVFLFGGIGYAVLSERAKFINVPLVVLAHNLVAKGPQHSNNVGGGMWGADRRSAYTCCFKHMLDIFGSLCPSHKGQFNEKAACR